MQENTILVKESLNSAVVKFVIYKPLIAKSAQAGQFVILQPSITKSCEKACSAITQ